MELRYDRPAPDECSPGLLPSRAAALRACRAAMEQGPVLITGGAGVGKTRIGRLAMEGDPARRWVALDAAPGMAPAEFLRAVGVALGGGEPTGSPRLAVAEALAASRSDGRPVALMLDEAHLAGDDLLEEFRLLGNRLDRADGPSALILCGQTALSRRLERRPLDGLESRLAARIHLLPLDVDEASELIARRDPACASDRADVERLHRDTGGNPARLLRLVPMRSERPAPPHLEAAPPARAVSTVVADEPLVPAKPPLLVEDGLIEVGWDFDPEPDPEPPPIPERTPRRMAMAGPAEERIDDHYAALQAWDEWARNSGRAEVSPPIDLPSDDETVESPPLPSIRQPVGDESGLWADGKQEFGPYSQLFSRLKPVQGTE